MLYWFHVLNFAELYISYYINIWIIFSITCGRTIIIRYTQSITIICLIWIITGRIRISSLISVVRISDINLESVSQSSEIK